MEPTKTEQPLIQLPPNDLMLFEEASSRWSAKIAQGVQPEALLVPSFWAHRATKLKPLDEIRAHAEDGTWVAYFIVLDCSRTWAKVKELSRHNLGTADVSLTQASEADVKAFIEQHNVVHRGPHKWSVVRKADKAVLQEGLALRGDAEAWLDQHARMQVGGSAAARAEPVAA